jgi:GntR family transcriptional regulator, galactonate operon transcriptional repressor
MNKVSPTSTAAIDADLRFHRAILAAGKNALLHQMGHLIAVGLYISHQTSSDSFTVFLPQHGKVLDAIRARDPQAARRTMEKLLNETREFITGHLKNGRKRAK